MPFSLRKDKPLRRSVWLALAGIAAAMVVYVLQWNASRHGDHAADVAANYTLIEPGLHIGGRTAQPPPDARVVLNLSQLRDDYQVAVSSWKPIADAAPAPSLDWLDEQVTFIDRERHRGETVFVHCDAGISRSSLVVSAYLMWRNQWTRQQALEFIRQTRPMVSPNPAFIELLDRWQQRRADAPIPATLN